MQSCFFAPRQSDWSENNLHIERDISGAAPPEFAGSPPPARRSAGGSQAGRQRFLTQGSGLEIPWDAHAFFRRIRTTDHRSLRPAESSLQTGSDGLASLPNPATPQMSFRMH